jgi:hypothetical protein
LIKEDIALMTRWVDRLWLYPESGITLDLAKIEPGRARFSIKRANTTQPNWPRLIDDLQSTELNALRSIKFPPALDTSFELTRQ